MSTSAISNVFSVLPTPANGSGKQDGNAAEAGAFNQVLSREMDRSPTDRGPTETTAKKETPTAGGDKNGKDSPNASSPSTESGKAVEDENGTAVADAPADEADIDPAAAAELAAFLAAMTQANPSPAATDIADDAAPLLADAKTTTSRTAIDPDTESVTTGIAITGKQEATGKGEDFVAALQKAAAPADGGKAVATNVKAEIDKAVTQAVKTVETSAPAAPQNLTATSAATTLQQLDQLQAQQANRLMPQVGSQDWNQALGQKVVWMVQGLQQTATLTLNPPDLGPMQVTVNVQQNQATANFTAAQPEVRHALEAAMPRLREMLNEAGIQLGQSSVSAGSPDQQGNGFADSQQNGQGSNHGAAPEATPTVSHMPTPAAGTGMVDTFA